MTIRMHLHRPPLWLPAAAALATALAPPLVLAQPPTLQCLLPGTGGAVLHGPCEFLDSMNVVFGATDADVTLVANFGLIRRDGAGALRYTCEEALGGLAWRARRAAAGDWLVGGAQGVLRHEAAGCSDRPQLVTLDGSDVVDVLVAPGASNRVWALTATPAALHRSEDGGRSFTRRFVFPPGEQPLKLAVGTGPGGEAAGLYAAGEDAEGRLLLRRSDDGGDSFQPPAGPPPPGIPRELLGVAPGTPGTVFAAVRVSASDGEHDEIWRAREAGRSWQRVLALPASEQLGGFSFGPGSTIYLGLREVLFGAAPAPARLLVSRDAGDSWEPPILSPRSGPRFRCLEARGDRLYACAGGQPNGDDFLLGFSTDGGHRWTPVMAVEEIAGPEPCLRATCLPTSEWLCSTYNLCENRPRDGGPTAEAGTTPAPDGGGCGCTLGGAATNGRSAALPLLLLVAATLIRRTWKLRTAGDGKSPARPPVPR